MIIRIRVDADNEFLKSETASSVGHLDFHLMIADLFVRWRPTN